MTTKLSRSGVLHLWNCIKGEFGARHKTKFAFCPAIKVPMHLIKKYLWDNCVIKSPYWPNYFIMYLPKATKLCVASSISPARSTFKFRQTEMCGCTRYHLFVWQIIICCSWCPHHIHQPVANCLQCEENCVELYKITIMDQKMASLIQSTFHLSSDGDD